jgi:hypothetical protein
MGSSLDSCDDRHSYVGYVFQDLNAFVMNLAPNAGIADITERGPIDIGNELPTCAREDYDLVRAILRNAVESLDKFRVSWRGHNERTAVAVEFSNENAFVISGQLQVVIISEIVALKLHRILLSWLVVLPRAFPLIKIRNCPRVAGRILESVFTAVSTFPSRGHNETACSANDLTSNPG